MEVREREMGRGEKGINKGERKKKENKRRHENKAEVAQIYLV